MTEDDKDQAPCVRWMISRRRFLEGAATALAVAPLLSGCEFAKIDGAGEGVEPTVDFDIATADFAGLATVGGMACVDAGGGIEILLVRADQDSVLGFERKCPHNTLDMGACGNNPLPGTWDANNRQLICNWHGSVFDDKGERVSGPTPRGLARYEVTFDATAGTGTVKVLS